MHGIRVTEFCHVVMGPTCGLVLADLGAEVIKVEPLDGDHTREVLSALGYAVAAIERMAADKVIKVEVKVD